jgi:hypothetical protein
LLPQQNTFAKSIVGFLQLLRHVYFIPQVIPVPAQRAFGILRGPLLEEVGVFDTVQDFRQPGEGVLGVVWVKVTEAELPHPHVGDVPDVGFDLVGRQTVYVAKLERKIDEGVFVTDNGLADFSKITLQFFGVYAGVLPQPLVE